METRRVRAGRDTILRLGDRSHPVDIVAELTYQQVSGIFLVDGESWKQVQRFSPNIGRPMHGQFGRGRFRVYGIAERAEWRSVAADTHGLAETLIYGRRSAPNEFSFEGPRPADGATGTTVRLIAAR
jgi:hypothetical protein